MFDLKKNQINADFYFYISFRDIVKSDQKHFTLGCKIWQTCKIPSWFYFTGFCESPTWAAKVCQPALRGWWFHLWKHLGAVGWQLRHGRAFTPEAKCKEDVMLTQSSPPEEEEEEEAWWAGRMSWTDKQIEAWPWSCWGYNLPEIFLLQSF